MYKKDRTRSSSRGILNRELTSGGPCICMHSRWLTQYYERDPAWALRRDLLLLERAGDGLKLVACPTPTILWGSLLLDTEDSIRNRPPVK